MKWNTNLFYLIIILSYTTSFNIAINPQHQIRLDQKSFHGVPSKSIKNNICNEELMSSSSNNVPTSKRKLTSLSMNYQDGSSETNGNNENVDNSNKHNDNRFQSILIKEANYNPSPANNYHDIENYTPKRSSYLSWQPYFLAIAKLTSQRSKDPQNQVGACIVDSNNRILGIGYNGFPRGCSDDILPWSSAATYNESSNDDKAKIKRKNDLHSKEYFMVQAEINAILNKIGSVSGATMYVYGSFPCNECAKVIIQAGISEVIYMDMDGDRCTKDDKCENKIKASRILFGLAGVKLTNYTKMLYHNEDGSSMIPRTPDLYFEIANDGDDQNHQTESSVKSNTNDSISEEHRELLIKEANYDPIREKQTQYSNNNQKRQEYLSWDDYFTAVASLSAYRSKDPNTQVGACIVDSNKCIIGIGYNGFPRGCSDDHLPWSRKAPNPLHTKYLYVVHAEVNAVLNKGSKDCTGATLYVALFPCNDCAKVIIQSGIKEVVYLGDTYHNSDMCKASRIMFEMAGVKCRQYLPSRKKINVDILNRGDEKN